MYECSATYVMDDMNSIALCRHYCMKTAIASTTSLNWNPRPTRVKSSNVNAPSLNARLVIVNASRADRYVRWTVLAQTVPTSYKSVTYPRETQFPWLRRVVVVVLKASVLKIIVSVSRRVRPVPWNVGARIVWITSEGGVKDLHLHKNLHPSSCAAWQIRYQYTICVGCL